MNIVLLCLGLLLPLGIVGTLFPRRFAQARRMLRKLRLISEARCQRPVPHWRVLLECLSGCLVLCIAVYGLSCLRFRVLPPDGEIMTKVGSGPVLPEELRAKMDAVAGEFVASGNTVGLAVGIIRDGKQYTLGFGRRSLNGNEMVDGNTVFEIGSITKTFTATLLADMARSGLVKLDDPVQVCLPQGVRVPDYGGQPIALLHLATHSSGLPRMPSNMLTISSAFAGALFGNPYASYSTREMYTFLAGYSLPCPPGNRCEYSNLGAGLLGLALANRAGTDYGRLVASRICAPLAMGDTGTALGPSQPRRLAQPYFESRRCGPLWMAIAASSWTTVPFAGAGMVRSTANDLLKYLAAQLGEPPVPETGASQDVQGLLSGMETTHEVRRKLNDRMDLAMAWHVLHSDRFPGPVFWHNGQTGGYRSFAAFLQEKKVAVVLLGNTTADLDGLGLRILSTAADAD